MDRQKFFNQCRKLLFNGKLSQTQVQGMDDLLDAWTAHGSGNSAQLAYVLGGVYHEVGKRMVPVREGFAATDRGARIAVGKLHKAGRITRNYAAPAENGQSYYGRGRIQNTHAANYKKIQQRYGFPVYDNPDLLLDSKTDAVVTVRGHVDGIWTGKKLSDYISGSKHDFKNARRIVNGTDKAELIAGYARKFLQAILEAEAGQPTPERPKPRPTEPPTPTPISQMPAGDFGAPNTETIELVQELLRDRGWPEVGMVDGKMGDRTRQAIAAFRLHAKLPLSDKIDKPLVEALMSNSVPNRAVSSLRANATIKTISDSPGVQMNQVAKWGGGLIAALGVGDAGIDFLLMSKTLGQMRSVWDQVAAFGPSIMIILVGLLVGWAGIRGLRWSLKRFRSGNHV